MKNEITLDLRKLTNYQLLAVCKIAKTNSDIEVRDRGYDNIMRLVRSEPSDYFGRYSTHDEYIDSLPTPPKVDNRNIEAGC